MHTFILWQLRPILFECINMADTSPTDTQVSTQPDSSSRTVSSWWRIAAVALMVALLVGWAASASMYEQLKAQIGHLQAKLQVLPQVRYVSVLLDDKQQAALLITFDPTAGVLQLQRLNNVAEGPEDSMQVWALSGGGTPPRSLGLVLSRYKTLQLPAKVDDLSGATELAISVEEKGGVSDRQGPRLPYLFKGWLVQRAI